MKNEDFESVKKSREIVKVITDYGVNQKDIINIIRKLSMEIEDIKLMKKINDILINKSEYTDTIEKIEI